MLDEDKLETAALIAQEVQNSDGRLTNFIKKWRDFYGYTEHQKIASIRDAKPYYEAFFGFDGWTRPTHDMTTGKRY